MSWLVLHVADKQEVRLLEENKGIRGLWGEGAYFCVFVYLYFFLYVPISVCASS